MPSRACSVGWQLRQWTSSSIASAHSSCSLTCCSAGERLGIIRDQVWGAPDLVVEVMSPGTEQRDRTQKLQWYRQYGVRECWLVDPRQELVTVVDWTGALPAQRTATGGDAIQSSVLPGLETTAAAVFL